MQNEGGMNRNIVVEKSFEFAVRVVNLYKFLTREHKEYVLAKQLLRAEPVSVPISRKRREDRVKRILQPR